MGITKFHVLACLEPSAFGETKAVIEDFEGRFVMSEEKKPTKPQPQPQQPRESTPTLPRTYGVKTWPELVGLTAEEAEKKIKEERPGAQVQVVPPNSFVTMDFRNNRVRLYVDSSGKVERPPSIG